MAKFRVTGAAIALSLAALAGATAAAAEPATSVRDERPARLAEARQNIALLSALIERRERIAAAQGDVREALAFLDRQIAEVAGEIARQFARSGS